MPAVHKEVMINAPAEAVFAKLTDPSLLPQIAPGVTEVKDLKQGNGVGDSFKVDYSVAGRKMPQKFSTVEYEQPSRLSLDFEGPLNGTFRYRLTPEGAGTKLTCDLEYQMKGGILGKALNALVVERTNEKNTESLLENLKRLVEAG
jgi:carbon monoxide dehydrogenase subunit G